GTGLTVDRSLASPTPSESPPPPVPGAPRPRGLRLLLHPIVGLFTVAVVAGALLRSLFFALSTWIWHFQQRIPDTEIVVWARWAVNQPDGAEPYALLAAVGVHWL